MKALVFDREEDLQDLIGYNLTKHGFEVIHLTDEEEVMGAISIHHPTLIVLGTCSSHERQHQLIDMVQTYGEWQDLAWLLVRLTTQDGFCDRGGYGPNTICVQTPVKPRELMKLIREYLNLSSLMLPD